MLFAKLMQYTVHFSHTFVIISQVFLCINQLDFELGIDLRFMNKLNSLSAKLDYYFVTEYAPVVKEFTRMWKILTTMMNLCLVQTRIKPNFF